MAKFLVRRCGPFSGHGVPITGVSRQYFTRRRCQLEAQPPNLAARLYLFKIRCRRESKVSAAVPTYEITGEQDGEHRMQ